MLVKVAVADGAMVAAFADGDNGIRLGQMRWWRLMGAKAALEANMENGVTVDQWGRM